MTFGFVIKDLRTQRVLMRGQSKGDPYQFALRESTNKAESGVPFLSTRASSDILHKRLGHPADRLLHHLRSQKCLAIDKVQSRLGTDRF